ncbi:hypothetical protein F2P81_015597 [Scophthalmus maximus]|uniref:Uncharacterized protein n=1 Tax=Scophthalmus maximus TaxID=52904 RepID=A0A6A4SJ73_SCOMX|nr:hypothetical protein F2P81_015597 [Scophthalmus maximus]
MTKQTKTHSHVTTTQIQNRRRRRVANNFQLYWVDAMTGKEICCNMIMIVMPALKISYEKKGADTHPLEDRLPALNEETEREEQLTLSRSLMSETDRLEMSGNIKLQIVCMLGFIRQMWIFERLQKHIRSLRESITQYASVRGAHLHVTFGVRRPATAAHSEITGNAEHVFQSDSPSFEGDEARGIVVHRRS